MTAAHVVYPEYVDPYEHSLEVIPALDWGDQPFGAYGVSKKPKIPKRYKDTHSTRGWDYALLTLSRRVGERTFKKLDRKPLCYWGHPSCGDGTELIRLQPRFLNGSKVATAGYPQLKGGRRLSRSEGTLWGAHWSQRLMYTSAHATPAQSGSPVWLEANKKYYLVGILVRVNGVVRVTQELLEYLRYWITADGDTPTM